MLVKSLRPILRQILGAITALVIKKHKPQVIVVTGSGQTSIVRENLYFALHERVPVRRNLEFPEAEFSVPLTVFGNFPYPKKRYLDWILIIFKVLFLLLKLKPYKHTIILELPNLNTEVFNYWIRILKPLFTLYINEEPDLIKNVEAIYEKVSIVTATYGLAKADVIDQLLKVHLPTSKIRFLRGKNGSMLLDNRHYYYPTSIQSVLEIAQNFDGKKYIFSDILEDNKYLDKSWIINPSTYNPTKNDITIVRGSKTNIALEALR